MIAQNTTDELLNLVKKNIDNRLAEFCEEYSFFDTYNFGYELELTPDAPFGFDLHIYFRSSNLRKNISHMLWIANEIVSAIGVKSNPKDYEWENAFDFDAEFTKIYACLDFIV